MFFLKFHEQRQALQLFLLKYNLKYFLLLFLVLDLWRLQDLGDFYSLYSPIQSVVYRSFHVISCNFMSFHVVTVHTCPTCSVSISYSTLYTGRVRWVSCTRSFSTSKLYKLWGFITSYLDRNIEIDRYKIERQINQIHIIKLFAHIYIYIFMCQLQLAKPLDQLAGFFRKPMLMTQTESLSGNFLSHELIPSAGKRRRK